MTQGISGEKAALRAQIRACRESRMHSDVGIHDRLLNEFTTARTIAGYIAYGHEPSVTSALRHAIATGKRVLLPILRADKDLAWGDWRGEELVQRGALNEPESGSLDVIAHADLIITPALAIDEHGHRLGQGGGSYDRALTRNTKATIIAVVYDDEILSAIPTDPHDHGVDTVITPTRTIYF